MANTDLVAVATGGGTNGNNNQQTTSGNNNNNNNSNAAPSQLDSNYGTSSSSSSSSFSDPNSNPRLLSSSSSSSSSSSTPLVTEEKLSRHLRINTNATSSSSTSSLNTSPTSSPSAASVKNNERRGGGGGGGGGDELKQFLTSTSPFSSTSSSTSTFALEMETSSTTTDPTSQTKTSFPPLFVMPSLWHILLFLFLVLVFILCSTVFRSSLESYSITPVVILQFASIPLISIVFTYCHIFLALYMTFYPIEYFGILQIPTTNVGLGWQGIIPFKAEKMARMAIQLMTKQLINIKEIFGRLDPQRVAVEIQPQLRALIENILDEIAKERMPDTWHLLPIRIKEEIISKVEEDAPLILANLMNDIKENLNQVFDLEHMVVELFVKEKDMLNQLFIDCGYKELSFIRNSGAYMGMW